MFELHIKDTRKVATGYKISSFRSHDQNMKFWISNIQGEGMEVSEKDLFDIIDKYFKEKF